MKKIDCKYCEWSWNEGEGGDDKYVCHICGNDNSKFYLNESEDKKKLFIPRRVDERYADLIKTMITTNYDIGEYLKRRDMYKDYGKNIDPMVLKLNKQDLITFVKANPFWLDSHNKIDYLFKTLSYGENKDIADNHIGNDLSGVKGGFFTTPELKYYEYKFSVPKNSFGKVDIYVFVGDDEYIKTSGNSFYRRLNIERLMKVSADKWNDTSDFGVGSMVKMMRMRAQANNKTLYKISTNKGLLKNFEGKSSSEMPPYILGAIDDRKERM